MRAAPSPSRRSRRRADRRCRATSRRSGGASAGTRVAEAMGAAAAPGRPGPRARSGIVVKYGVSRSRSPAGSGGRPRSARAASSAAAARPIESASTAASPSATRTTGMPCSSATSVEAYSQHSRTITSGRQSSTIARRPGSAAAVSMRAKYSPIIAALAVSRSSCANSASSGIHCSGGGSPKGANGRPARSTLPACWRLRRDQHLVPGAQRGVAERRERASRARRCPRVVRRIRIDRQSHHARRPRRGTGDRPAAVRLVRSVSSRAHARRPPPAVRPGRDQGARARPDAQVRPARPRGDAGRAAQRGHRPRGRRRAARAAGLQDARRARRPRAVPALGRRLGRGRGRAAARLPGARDPRRDRVGEPGARGSLLRHDPAD